MPNLGKFYSQSADMSVKRQPVMESQQKEELTKSKF